jgi:SAM-dependent methyltransferase
MKPIRLAGFEQIFQADADPWRTFSDRDEAFKRAAIVRGLGAMPIGRVLELGAGNGSNSVAIAGRALRLDATEGTAAGAHLVAGWLAGHRRARALRLILPARFPRPVYDVVVIAELLYYLSRHDMNRVAGAVGRTLRPGGRLVLAHHRIDFHDFAQRAAGLHARFLAATRRSWRRVGARRTRLWRVEAYLLSRHSPQSMGSRLPTHCLAPGVAAEQGSELRADLRVGLTGSRDHRTKSVSNKAISGGSRSRSRATTKLSSWTARSSKKRSI